VTIFDTLQQRLGIDPRELAGTAFTGEIPIPASLVNRLLAQRLARNPQIGSLQLDPQPDDTVFVRVEPRVRMMPALKVTARIERQPEFPSDPTLHLRWSMPAAGPLAMFAAPVLAYFRAMPRGIRMDADRISVDIRELLRAKGLEEAVGLIRRAAIHTRPGGFVLQIEAGL
jgi:hypothetical protein